MASGWTAVNHAPGYKPLNNIDSGEGMLDDSTSQDATGSSTADHPETEWDGGEAVHHESTSGQDRVDLVSHDHIDDDHTRSAGVPNGEDEGVEAVTSNETLQSQSQASVPPETATIESRTSNAGVQAVEDISRSITQLFGSDGLTNTPVALAVLSGIEYVMQEWKRLVSEREARKESFIEAARSAAFATHTPENQREVFAAVGAIAANALQSAGGSATSSGSREDLNSAFRNVQTALRTFDRELKASLLQSGVKDTMLAQQSTSADATISDKDTATTATKRKTPLSEAAGPAKKTKTEEPATDDNDGFLVATAKSKGGRWSEKEDIALLELWEYPGFSKWGTKQRTRMFALWCEENGLQKQRTWASMEQHRQGPLKNEKAGTATFDKMVDQRAAQPIDWAKYAEKAGEEKRARRSEKGVDGHGTALGSVATAAQATPDLDDQEPEE